MKLGLIAIQTAALLLAATAALGQERAENRFQIGRRVNAPSDALEVAVGTGYDRGFGLLESGTGIPSVVASALAVDFGLAYRIDPDFAVGLTAQYQDFDAQRADTAHGAAFTLGVTRHLAPFRTADPFVQIGSGYRMLVERSTAGTTSLTHGLELAKLTVGVDLKLTDDIAVGPLLSASMSTFLWRDAGTPLAIVDPRLSAFVFAGAQGHFYLGGKREREPAREEPSPNFVERRTTSSVERMAGR